jgi:hypothetical protein
MNALRWWGPGILVLIALAGCGPPTQLRTPEWTHGPGTTVLIRLPEDSPDAATERAERMRPRPRDPVMEARAAEDPAYAKFLATSERSRQPQGFGTHYVFPSEANHVGHWPDLINAFNPVTPEGDHDPKSLTNTRVWVVRDDGALFYGRITVFGIEANATGPASRNYYLEIGSQYFEMATDGRIAVTYETYPVPGSVNRYAWILWLSDRDF